MISRMLLSQKNAITENASNYDFSNEAFVGEAYMNNACLELAAGICECDSQYMIADTIGTAKVLTESADANVLLENIIKDGIHKLVVIWEKFIAKVKEYYRKVVDFFKAMTATGKKFVDQFGTQLKDKAGKAKSFKYTGYEYNLKKGDDTVSKVKDTINGKINTVLKGFDEASTGNKSVEELKAMLTDDVAGSKTAPTASEFAEDVIKNATKDNDVSGMKDTIKKNYHNGDTSKKEGLTLNSSLVGEMCKWISDSKESIKQANDDYKNFEKVVGLIIGKLNGIKKADDEKAYTKASVTSSYLSALCNVLRAATTVKVDIYREAARAYTSVLKALYRHREKKDAMDAYVAEGDDIDIEPEMETDLVDTDQDLADMEEACKACEEADQDDDIPEGDDPAEEGTSLFEQAMRYL